jgi:magnesium-transporting ATPase (P-type)
VVWGATGGIVLGLLIKGNPEYQQKVRAFLQERGIDTNADMAATRAAYSKLTLEDQNELNSMSRDAMRNINWFLVTLFVSVVVFGGVGFLSGIVAGQWALAPLIPALSFLLNNPVIRFAMAKELPPFQKAIVVAVQFVVCTGLALLGAVIAGRNKHSGQQAAAGDRGLQ